jgi:alcohol dehydrogenase class IV
MAMASMLGGAVIAFPWIGGPAILGHCLAEAFGPKYGVAHGIAVGLALPYILDFNMPACREKIVSFAPALGVERGWDSAKVVAGKVPQALLELMRDVDLPTTLKQVNFPKGDLDSFAEYIFKQRQHIYGLPRYNPRRLTLENTTKLLHDMYEGALEA